MYPFACLLASSLIHKTDYALLCGLMIVSINQKEVDLNCRIERNLQPFATSDQRTMKSSFNSENK